MYHLSFQSHRLGSEYDRRKGAAHDQTTLFAKALFSKLRKSLYVVLAIVLSVTLSACKGGSSSGNNTPDPTVIPPSSPTLSLTTKAIKTFSFSWEDVSDETEYRLLENPDGASGFTQVATLEANITAHDLAVLLPARINASYKLQACNSGGCADSDTVNVTGSLTDKIGYIKASNTGSDDSFGFAIAISGDGNTLAVGAPYEDSNATTINGAQDNNDVTSSGAVYVFTRSGHTWTQQAYIKASNALAYDKFGSSLALSEDGNTMAVGAVQADTSVANSGAAYIYTREGTTWSEQAMIEALNAGDSDQFGHRVALSGDGNTLAVSAYGEDGDGVGINDDINDLAIDSGAVYLFTRTGTTWSQQAYVKASNTSESDQFGISVALSDDGSTLAVGALYEKSTATGINGDQNALGALATGAVYLFANEGGNWSQEAYIKASNTEADDEFGYAVALSADGNTLAVGAPYEDSNATTINGVQEDNNGTESGAVYLFTRSGFTWTQQAYIKSSNSKGNNITTNGDQFGYSLTLSDDGNTLAVGAISESSSATGINGDQTDISAPNSGAVYLFTRNGTTWSQQAYIKAPNAEEDDLFSTSIALDGNGNTLAIGAESETSSASGINGDQTDNSASYSGAVYLY